MGINVDKIKQISKCKMKTWTYFQNVTINCDNLLKIKGHFIDFIF